MTTKSATYITINHVEVNYVMVLILNELGFLGRRQKRLAKVTGSNMPDLRDQEAVQKFFLSEVQLGEDLLSQGDVEGAVEHLGSAIAVCGHPQQLLQILQQTLPPQVFHRLLQRLPMIGQVIAIKLFTIMHPPN